MNLLSRVFLFFIIFISGSALVFGETKTSVASGNWNIPSVWSPEGVPVNNDDVIIGTGTTVTVDVNTEIINSLTIQSGAVLQGDGTGRILLIGGAEGIDFVNNGTFNANGAYYMVVRLNNNSEWAGNSPFNCSTVDLNGNTLTFASSDEMVLNLSGSPDPFLNPGSVVPGTSTTLNYNGTSEQILSISTFNSLTISNSAGVSLGGNVTVNGILNLSTGVVTTNSYSLIITSTGSVTRSDGHVNGNFQKYIDLGPTVIDFEIGDLTTYSPVSLHFDSVTTAGNLVATSQTSDHPFLSNSGIDADKSVNRYWTLTNQGVAFSFFNATFIFVSSDLDVGANTDAFIVEKYNGSEWNPLQTGVTTPTSAQINHVSDFSDFAIGEIKSYSIIASATTHGTIDPVGTIIVTHGSDQSFIITPDIECYLDSLVVDGIHVDSTTSYTFNNVTSDHSISAYFSITTYTLTTSATNGTVTRNPDQTEYDYGSTVELTAIPDQGYHFVDWNGDASGNANPLTITMDGDKNITANFAINTYTLTVNATNGSVTKDPDQTAYDHGSTVELTAIPDFGYHFVEWSGDAGGSTNPLTIVMDGYKNITANFVLNTYIITANATEHGTIDPAGTITVSHGTDQSFTITPDIGCYLDSLVIDGIHVDSTTSYTFNNVTSDHSISAYFSITTYTLTTSATNGTVVKNPDQSVYDYGTTVELTAMPEPGYHFVDWSGDASGSTNPLTITMDGDKNITANFAINTYTITADASAHGTINPAGAVSVTHGADQSFTITPDIDCRLDSLIVDGLHVDSTTSYTFKNVTSDNSISAYFSIITYTITVSATNGTVTKNPDQETYVTGTTVELTATPDEGYHFVEWSGDASGSANPITITMDGDKNITANFAINTYSLSVNATNGTVSKNPDQSTYGHGTTVELTATPNTGYNFVNWSGDASGSANPLTITMDGNKNITANFDINTYTLTTSATNGTINRNPDQASYAYGTSVQLTAVPNTGYHFVSWSGHAGGSENPLTITMDGDKNITANFAINTYTLTTNATNGTVSKNPNQTTYNHGTTVQLTATPNSGYRFANWSGDVSGSANPITVTMDNNKNVTANFVANTYTLTVNATNGTVTKLPNQTSYEYGTAVQLTATPNTGYHFVSWSGDASGSSNPITITIDGNKNITANFAINQYILTITALNGTVSKSPNQLTYNHGTTVRLTAMPNTGYHFIGWSGDVSSTSNPVSITMNSDKNIYANFEINTYSLSVTALGNGSVTINPDLAVYEHGTMVELTATPFDTGWSFSRWSGDLVSTKNPVIFMIDNNKNITATFAPNTAYDVVYRSMTAENLALDVDNKGKRNKFVKRKPDKVEFRFMLIADSVRELTLEFSKNIRSLYIIKVSSDTQSVLRNYKEDHHHSLQFYAGDTIYKNNFFGNIKEIYIKLEPAVPLLRGDTMLVHGFCETHHEIKVKYRWAGSESKYVPYFILNNARLPMPNRVNILYEAFIQGGYYGTGGLTVGLPRYDSSKYYGWFQTQRYSDILRTLIISKTSEMHTGRPRGFDISWSGKVLLNQLKILPPNRHNNILLAEMIALKLNIVASAMGKIPRGFGELIYGDETENPLNGMTVKEIAHYGDVLITGAFRQELRRKLFASSAEYDNLAQTIHRINASFEGSIDTVAFGDSLVLKGLMALRNVPCLHANPYATITIITPQISIVSDKPEAYALYQNYPNPFNPTTTIEYELSDDAVVTLKVYNILGQEVATLIDREWMEAGIQDIEFNGTGLASGVYLYRLIAEKKPENESPGPTLNIVKKMILLK